MAAGTASIAHQSEVQCEIAPTTRLAGASPRRDPRARSAGAPIGGEPRRERVDERGRARRARAR